ncbi:TMOD [Lepeophtheirus salmonis]|uniref:TMOD n=1 Tax=Lepeophtheirus salmonis TaxID=72036 RepID=A0A7R8CHZ0_LEPSM|nr:TMOD [Lepeophtheirus salmonis]CAF2827120.1 TMOD [Lepeophtheirus salmonis]
MLLVLTPHPIVLCVITFQDDPGEIQRLLDECDPDDPNIPPSMRTNYKCEKNSTGPLDRKKLLDYINEQALNTPDVVDPVPYVPGCVRGKKWMAPPKPVPARSSNEETIELDIDFGDEYEMALNTATTDEIVDLAGILGLHSMMNQDQFHSAQSDKWADKPDPSIGWNGITKATPLKQYPAEKPNTTNPSEVISRLKESDAEMKSANLNNVVVSESQFLEMFDALRHNDSLTELSLSNTTLGDFATANLACSLKQNKTLEKLNIESNNISPPTLIKIFEAMNESQTLTEIKASNQQAQFLGNKVEMAITKHIEGNKTIMRVGLHFEFGDCRNRVAVQLQKNLDRIRFEAIIIIMRRVKPKIYLVGINLKKKRRRSLRLYKQTTCCLHLNSHNRLSTSLLLLIYGQVGLQRKIVRMALDGIQMLDKYQLSVSLEL